MGVAADRSFPKCASTGVDSPTVVAGVVPVTVLPVGSPFVRSTSTVPPSCVAGILPHMLVL